MNIKSPNLFNMNNDVQNDFLAEETYFSAADLFLDSAPRGNPSHQQQGLGFEESNKMDTDFIMENTYPNDTNVFNNTNHHMQNPLQIPGGVNFEIPLTPVDKRKIVSGGYPENGNST